MGDDIVTVNDVIQIPVAAQFGAGVAIREPLTGERGRIPDEGVEPDGVETDPLENVGLFTEPGEIDKDRDDANQRNVDVTPLLSINRATFKIDPVSNDRFW